MTKNIFETYATPISIIVAGALIGAGILLGKQTGRPDQVPKSGTQETAGNTTDQNAASIANLPILKTLGVRSKDLSACIANKTYASVVDNDIALGQKAGLKGTPHMIVMMSKDGKEIQFPLLGAQPKETIEAAIAAGKAPDSQSGYAVKFENQVLTETDHIRGNATAPATIVEYSDIDCPFCKRLHPVLKELADEGKIKWVFRHSPIPSLHPDAYNKALATECVNKLGNDGAFWKFLDEIAV